MKRIIYFIFCIIFFFILSCKQQTKNKDEIYGYWREYLTETKDYYHSIHINDSLLLIDHILNGFSVDNEYNNGKLVIPYDNLKKETTDYVIRNDSLFINDTLRWIRITYTDSIFLEDISGILKLYVLPPFCNQKEDYFNYDCTYAPVIHIGKVKDSFKKEILIDSLYCYEGFSFQLNDYFGSIDEVIEFHYTVDSLILNADKKVSNELIELICLKRTNLNPNAKIFRTYVDKENRELKIRLIN